MFNISFKFLYLKHIGFNYFKSYLNSSESLKKTYNLLAFDFSSQNSQCYQISQFFQHNSRVFFRRFTISGFFASLSKAKQWAIADCLGFISKDVPESRRHAITILIRRGWLPFFGTLKGITWMVIWRTLHPRRILMHKVPLTYSQQQNYSNT